MCFESETQTWSFGSMCNWPPHLDHDHDCTPNHLDEDFQNLGISQNSYEDLIREHWEENYEGEHGGYDDYWENFYDDWDDEYFWDDGFWDDLADIWDSIFDWLDDQFDFGGGSYDDLYIWEDDDVRCPYDDPLQGGLEGRDLDCKYIVLYDDNCVHDPWWEFPYGIDNEEAIFRFRLSNFWEVNLQGVIDYTTLENLVLEEGLDPYDMDFEQNVHWFLYHYFYQELVANQETTLDEAAFENLYHQIDLWVTYSDCVPNNLLFNALIFGAKHDASEDVMEYIREALSLIGHDSDYKWERLEELYGILAGSGEMVLNTDCFPPNYPVTFWADLASFTPPQTVTDRIANEDDYELQPIQNATSKLINLDYFPVQVNTMPTINGVQLTADELLNHVRLNLNSFPNENLTWWEAIPSDASLWNSNDPLTAIVHIEITGDDGAVITSQYESCCWIFSTLTNNFWWDGDGGHPVSGNRQFGYSSNPDGSSTFYTKGTDRIQMGLFYIGFLKENTERPQYSIADGLWDDFQNSLVNFVNEHNGIATYLAPTIARPDYNTVKEQLKSNTPITFIPCN